MWAARYLPKVTPTLVGARLTATTRAKVSDCQLLIVGGGSGGLATAAILGKRFKTILVEPSDDHYYQPFFTLVGAGIKNLEDCRQPLKQLVPTSVTWLKQRAVGFDPVHNCVETDSGRRIIYDILVVATGVQPDFSRIPGLTEALETPHVGSNYTAETVLKTTGALRAFKRGNAIFTFPSTPIKCPGAPQKIAYLTDEYLRKQGKREDARIIFNTAGGVLFGVKKYADALWEVVQNKGIEVNLAHNLVEVDPDSKLAFFEKAERNKKKRVSLSYEMLHVTPPMFPIKAVANSALADKAGYVDINRRTLQHNVFKNVFAIGDCTAHLPKTAAAVAASVGVLADNLAAFHAGKDFTGRYNGYTSCPLTTGFSKCILAEFDGFNAEPMETFPFDQGKERYSMYFAKKDVIPAIYWKLFVKGYWKGPSSLRRLMRFGAPASASV